MNPAPLPHTPALPSALPSALRHACQALLLAGLAHTAATHAAAPAPPAQAPLRLDSPEERALLIERINAALERTNQKHSSQPRKRGRSGATSAPTIPSVAVQVVDEKPTTRPHKKSPVPRVAAPAALGAAAASVAAFSASTAASDTQAESTEKADGTHSAAPASQATPGAAVTSATSALPDNAAAPKPTPEATPEPQTTPKAEPKAESKAAPKTEPQPAPPTSAKRDASAQAVPVQPPVPGALSISRQEIKARAMALAAEQAVATPLPDPATVQWSYQGDTGPQAWGQLHPAFATCDQGQRQSPLHITAADTVTGPAEPLWPGAQVFSGTVVHTGKSIGLEVEGIHTLVLRGMRWQLQQVEFHHPAEEKIHHHSFPMATDLVYRGPQGQLAVLSVPMQLGAANTFLKKVWTYMPLDSADSVRMPPGQLQLHELLPSDLRYYQYLGSLTTPPCTEGVLRLVLKTPASVGPEQLRLLERLTPANARPAQPAHGRLVREAQ